jgi:hypothetical protein
MITIEGTKSETRNSKQIQGRECRENSKQGVGSSFGFPSPRFIWQRFVSDFGIRISDFVPARLTPKFMVD